MKKIFMLIIMTVFCFIGVRGAEAALPNSFTLIENGEGVNRPSNPIVKGWSDDDAIHFSYKYMVSSGNQYLVFCTGDRLDPANVNSNAYSITNDWTEAVRAGMGTLIIHGVGENATTAKYSNTSSDLFTTQMAIWKYLENKGLYNGGSLTYTMDSMEKNYVTLYNRVNNLVKYATEAETKIVNINNFAPTLNTTALTFTKSGENYVSNTIKVNGSYISSVTPTVNIGTVSGDNSKGYVVTVPVSKLSSENVSVTLSFNVKSQSQALARNYSSGSGYQTTTLTLLETKNNSKSLSASGTITVTPTLTLKKVDDKGTLIDGATVKVTKDGAEYQTLTLKNGTASITSGLSYGKYCVTEVTAPSGYVKTKISSCVTLSATNPNGTITVTNKKTSVSFKKIDAKTEKALAGATLQILDKDKNIIMGENNQPKYQWVSTSDVHIIDGLPVGTYYLKEVAAPQGYSLNSNLVEFTIKEDGSVTVKDQPKTDTMVIIMENSMTVTSFSKQDATTGKELPGATLQILDKDKKEIKDKDGKVLYKWVSTKEPHIIEGLPVGIYYLKEVIQPEGYELSEELVKFEVKSDGTVTKVVMKNAPIVEVPDTALSKSALIITIGTIIVGAGIGLIIYATKRKKNSEI